MVFKKTNQLFSTSKELEGAVYGARQKSEIRKRVDISAGPFPSFALPQ
jgi:hypothetical protein